MTASNPSFKDLLYSELERAETRLTEGRLEDARRLKNQRIEAALREELCPDIAQVIQQDVSAFTGLMRKKGLKPNQEVVTGRVSRTIGRGGLFFRYDIKKEYDETKPVWILTKASSYEVSSGSRFYGAYRYYEIRGYSGIAADEHGVLLAYSGKKINQETSETSPEPIKRDYAYVGLGELHQPDSYVQSQLDKFDTPIEATGTATEEQICPPHLISIDSIPVDQQPIVKHVRERLLYLASKSMP